MKRYLHKYSKDRKNLKKLKPHEKDFLFQHLSLLVGEVSGINPKLKYTFSTVNEYYQYIERKGLTEHKFDLYKIEEAHEYLFYKLILTYFDNLHFQEKSYSASSNIYNHFSCFIRYKSESFYFRYPPIFVTIKITFLKITRKYINVCKKNKKVG